MGSIANIWCCILVVSVRDPSEFHFYGVHCHISNGARTMPGRYLKFEVARRPSTSRTGAADIHRGPVWRRIASLATRPAPCRWPTAPFPCSVLLNTFFGVRIVYIFSETVLLKDLSTRVHSFNEKNIKTGRKGDLENTEAACYCGSSNVEPGGGDVAFGEAEEDAP